MQTFRLAFAVRKSLQVVRALTSALVVLLILTSQVSIGRAESPLKLDYLMFRDPDFPRAPQITKYADRLAETWIEALNRPEIDLQRMAGESIARAATMDVPNLKGAIPRLRELVAAEKTHLAARSAACKALVALEVRDAADIFAKAAADHPGDIRRITETALASWGDNSLKETWRARIVDPKVGHRDLVLALRGLGAIGDVDSVPRLLEMTHNSLTTAEIRIEAATAAGRIKSSDLATDAQKLIDSKLGLSLINRLCAVRLVARHTASVDQAILLKLAVDSEPAVAADALKMLNAIDSNLVLPLAADAIRNTDHQVRRQGLIAFVKLPTPERIGPVCELLNDPVPDLRIEVREHLNDLIKTPELVDSIWAGVTRVLGNVGWRGQEQAALFVGEHEYKPVANRLLELQSIPRAEARVAAAWALQRIRVEETCPAILKRCEQLTKQRTGGPPLDGLDEQVAHLFEAMVKMNYWQAEPLWLQYVPKNPPMGLYSRSTAIWALGLRHNGVAKPELAAQLIERMTDTAPVPPELEHVRYACAISLARIQGKDHVPRMITWAGEEALKSGNVVTPHALAIRWAVMQMTGVEYPELQPVPSGKGGWFLEPIQANVK